jgi:hypothetical protein
MSDDNNNDDSNPTGAPLVGPQHYPDRADVLADLERIVAARGEAQVTITKPQSMSYNTATGELRANGALVDVNAQPGAESVSPDTNVDIVATHNAALAKYDALVASLDEITHYDVNGEPVYKIAHPAERERVTREVAQMRESLAYQAQRYTAILQAQEARKAAEERKTREDYARRAWTGGDPVREKMLKDAIDKAEADEIARKIVLSRAGKL